MNQDEQQRKIMEALVGDRVELYQTSSYFNLAISILSRGALTMVNEAAKRGIKEHEKQAELRRLLEQGLL